VFSCPVVLVAAGQVSVLPALLHARSGTAGAYHPVARHISSQDAIDVFVVLSVNVVSERNILDAYRELVGDILMANLAVVRATCVSDKHEFLFRGMGVSSTATLRRHRTLE